MSPDNHIAGIHITDAPLDPPALLEGFTAQVQSAGFSAGAITSFTGLVRADAETDTLTLSHYAGFTEAQIAQIAQQAQSRWPLLGLTVHHRTGEMRAGEAIVFIAAASAHRRAAFEACDFVMDFLKSEAPFWKQETQNGTPRWIEPRADDISDKARWNS
jgi:molybdopterin synthase catalytic subunit